ncbi:MAG: hypothetical protein EDR02_01485 [Actinobacteria bacterium]|nr:MAG: hypothetical protein EDR02_01485 [Actinomycetota bacterium]
MRYVIEDRGHPKRLLVLLHGHDSSECEAVALGPLVDPAQRYLVVGLRAPLPHGTGRASWYENGPSGPIPTSFESAGELVATAVKGICQERHLEAEETVIVGFSQGASVAMAVALEPSCPVPAGVVSLNGFFPEVDGLELDWGRSGLLHVLVVHGRNDDIVPVDFGRDLAETLRDHGSRVTYVETDAGHQLTVEGVAAVRDWLAALPKPAEDQH